MLIPDWQGAEIHVARSRGGVLAVQDPWENVVRTGISPWPTPELIQKIYQSRQHRAFSGEDHAIASNTLGFYSDLQSLHSEDAITWSVFGPIIYSTSSIRRQYVSDFLHLIGLRVDPFNDVALWLWRRLPHPHTLVSGDPEIDFGIQTESLFLLGECKWLSGVGKYQGVGKDKTQLELRQEFCEKYGHYILPECRDFLVLSISLDGGLLNETTATVDEVSLHTRDTTWQSLIELNSHPLKDELQNYLNWKLRHSRLPSEGRA